jgi:hypothetical protein
MQLPKVTWADGDDVATVTLRGDKQRQPEPTHFRVVLPFGDVDIARCEDGSYWVHVLRNTEQDVREEKRARAGQILDGRVDLKGRHASECSAGDLGHPDAYHVAVRLGAA